MNGDDINGGATYVQFYTSLSNFFDEQTLDKFQTLYKMGNGNNRFRTNEVPQTHYNTIINDTSTSKKVKQTASRSLALLAFMNTLVSKEATTDQFAEFQRVDAVAFSRSPSPPRVGANASSGERSQGPSRARNASNTLLSDGSGSVSLPVPPSDASSDRARRLAERQAQAAQAIKQQAAQASPQQVPLANREVSRTVLNTQQNTLSLLGDGSTLRSVVSSAAGAASDLYNSAASSASSAAGTATGLFNSAASSASSAAKVVSGAASSAAGLLSSAVTGASSAAGAASSALLQAASTMTRRGSFSNQNYEALYGIDKLELQYYREDFREMYKNNEMDFGVYLQHILKDRRSRI